MSCKRMNPIVSLGVSMLLLLVGAAAHGAEDVWLSKIKVKTAEGREWVSFKTRAGLSKIEYPGAELKGKVNAGRDKVVYTLNGTKALKVKLKDRSFKLKSNEGALLYKVKYDDYKVRIADNENLDRPFVLKHKGHKVKVLRDERLLGEARMNEAGNKVKVKSADGRLVYQIKTDRLSAAYGVLLLDTIEAPYRFVIMAELIAMGY